MLLCTKTDKMLYRSELSLMKSSRQIVHQDPKLLVAVKWGTNVYSVFIHSERHSQRSVLILVLLHLDGKSQWLTELALETVCLMSLKQNQNQNHYMDSSVKFLERVIQQRF